MERNGGKAANVMQAGVYGEVLHYLKAIMAAGSDEAKAVVAKMKKMPIEDFYPRRAPSRNTPTTTTSVKDAFRPLNEGGCPFVKIAADTASIRACRFASVVRLGAPIAPTISFVGIGAATAFRETL
jgi:hypothetical protein